MPLILPRAPCCLLTCHEHKGFVDQFATVTNAKGVRVLDANHVGLWGAMNYVTQAISQFGSPLTAQAFGIRFNLYLFTLLKLVVSWSRAWCGSSDSKHLQADPGSNFSPRADHHHRDILHHVVALFARQAFQWLCRRSDRYLGHVVRFRNRHVADARHRPIILCLLLCSGTTGKCYRSRHHQPCKSVMPNVVNAYRRPLLITKIASFVLVENAISIPHSLLLPVRVPRVVAADPGFPARVPRLALQEGKARQGAAGPTKAHRQRLRIRLGPRIRRLCAGD
jgi:hypothetical protein